jgi:UDP-N-acetylmuramoyl-L-alanyl-D-glutamate--2,6-diaminopimelate ligase
VVVDYAHTDDALDKALSAVREVTRGEVHLVFGCGGDRDRSKRPRMGEVAARRADGIFVTSDNPRSEDPGRIAAEVLAGLGRRQARIQLDRRRAIREAIARARPGDAVLIAGKGHETYQLVGPDRLPFDDAEVAREALAAALSRG